MRLAAAVAALLILSACGSRGAPAPNTQQRADPAAKAPAAPKAEPSANTASARDDPALTELSPSRRRAYQRGFADCRAGRYAPDRYSEAYRIGCAAAHDR